MKRFIFIFIFSIVVALVALKLSDSDELPAYKAEESLNFTAAASEPTEPVSPSPEPGPCTYIDGNLVAAVNIDDRTYVKLDDLSGALDKDFWRDGIPAPGQELLEVNEVSYVDIEDYCEGNGIAIYEDVVASSATLYITSAAGQWEVPSGVSVPVLMYHYIGDAGIEENADLYVRQSDLRQQLEYLIANGYTPIFFKDLKYADLYEKPIILTFDDGHKSIYSELFPLLKEMNIKATVFVVSGYIGNGKSLDSSQIYELSSSRLVDIQYHTMWHPNLDEMSYEAQIPELCWGKVDIMRYTHNIPYVLAYPSGKQDDNTLMICQNEFKFAVKMSGPIYITGETDPLLIYRKYVPREMDIWTFADLIEQ